MNIKSLTLPITIALTTLVTHNVSASELTASRSLFPDHQGAIAAQLKFNQKETGDIYVAYRMNGEGELYFLNSNGFSLEALPYDSIESFNGVIELPKFDTLSIPAGNYQLYQVLVKPNSNVFDVNNWVNGFSALNSINFSVGQESSVNFDLDGDGWSDDDHNKDGYHDDDHNKDGYHDDDHDKDGYHDDDHDKDGYHDDDHDKEDYHDNDEEDEDEEDKEDEEDEKS